MALYKSANELIGNTPLLELTATAKVKGFCAKGGECLCTEVIVVDIFGFNTKRIEHLVYSVTHWAGTTHVVFDIFWCFMIFEICLIDNLVNKARSVLHACCISSWIRTVKCQVETEIGEFLFNCQEIFKIEHFVKRTCYIEIVHDAICCAKCFGHVHDLSTQRSHTSATTYPHHFCF